MNQLLTTLKWRYATKVFDPTKKISEPDLSDLIESVRLAPTSYGLQTFRLVNVKDRASRQQIQAAAYGQGQVSQASDLFVLIAQKVLTPEHIEKFFKNLEAVRNQTPEQSASFRQMIETVAQNRPAADQLSWHSQQTYIALGFLLFAAAKKGIDACPMEGFDKEKVGQILQISDNEVVTVICPLGYRDNSDTNATKPKVRFPVTELYSIK